MSGRRIPKTPHAVLHVLRRAAAAIAAEPDWSASAPSAAAVTALADALEASIRDKQALRGHLKIAERTEKDRTLESVQALRRIDYATDGLYTPRGAQKENFGIPAKKPTHGHSVPLTQPVILKIADGVQPGSLLLDWEPVRGAAAYQVAWFTDGALAQPAGSAAVSGSEYTLTGLQPGLQYWVKVCAIRGKDSGPWSDPATRIANM